MSPSRFWLAVSIPLWWVIAATAGISVERLRCEYLENPLGIDSGHPRLSWILKSGERNQKQTSYQILAAPTTATLKAGAPRLFWDSGKVDSDETVGISYDGKTLRPSLRCYWKIR